MGSRSDREPPRQSRTESQQLFSRLAIVHLRCLSPEVFTIQVSWQSDASHASAWDGLFPQRMRAAAIIAVRSISGFSQGICERMFPQWCNHRQIPNRSIMLISVVCRKPSFAVARSEPPTQSPFGCCPALRTPAPVQHAQKFGLHPNCSAVRKHPL